MLIAQHMALAALLGAAPKAPPCQGLNLAPFAEVALQPGEELSYEISVKGAYVGRVDIKTGRPRTINGKSVIPLFGRVRTNSFAAQFKSLEGRFMSFIDRGTLRPMLVRTESVYGKEKRRERVLFDEGAPSVHAEYVYLGRNGERRYDGRDAPLFDLLSVMHYARTRALALGDSACQEIYVDRRLWRMTGKVDRKESVATPAGKKEALVLSASFKRLPHKDFNPRASPPEVDVRLYLSNDASRVPLAFEATMKGVTIKGELTSWSSRGRDDDGAWEF